MSIIVEELSVSDFDPKTLSEYLSDFYRAYPWNEYLRCPKCSDPDKYDITGTYGYKDLANQSEPKCPNCGSDMELFWGEDRSFNYLMNASRKEGFKAFKAIDTDTGSLVGWVWGYSILPSELLLPGFEGKSFYLDLICVLKEYRNTRPPIVGELYLYLLDYLMSDSSYNYLITRTHKKATNVRRMLIMVGFMETGIVSKEDIQRDYWIRPLDE
ncbi:hypothetical protein HGB13_03460 [bacterium]|nr:hypothetical protein [bacterium]